VVPRRHRRWGCREAFEETKRADRTVRRHRDCSRHDCRRPGHGGAAPDVRPDKQGNSAVSALVQPTARTAARRARLAVLGRRCHRRRDQQPGAVRSARGRARAAGVRLRVGGRARHRQQLHAQRNLDVQLTSSVTDPLREVQPHRTCRAPDQRRGRVDDGEHGSALPGGQSGRHRRSDGHQSHRQYDMDMGAQVRWNRWCSQPWW
jgi:hypothetical protein